MTSPEDILIMLVIGTPVYFFWRWLYLKFINDHRKRQIATWASTVLITPLIFRGAIVLLLFCLFYYPKKDFDKKEWAANKEKRYQMSKNIIESKMFIGKTEEQVKALLGDGQTIGDRNHWIYYLGFVPSIGIDPDELDVIFENGKVVKVGQHNN